MTIPFLVFGSLSSQDADLLVLVDSIPQTQEAKNLCVKYQAELQPLFNKPTNVNLGVVLNGVLTSVLKGSLDEVNNSLIDTYTFHEQKFPLIITTRMERNVEDKVLRSTRIVLATLSRSQYRVTVKAALKENLIGRLAALETIDFSQELKEIKYPLKDIYKTLAFQMGQALALLDGKECYTKESIVELYPELNPFLRREDCNLGELEKFKSRFISAVRKFIPQMNSLEEKLN